MDELIFNFPKEKIIVDECDQWLVDKYKWYLAKGYVRKSRHNSGWALHRIIMGAKTGDIVDHINGDKLDNRRCNLRLTTAAVNAANRRGANKGSRSGHRCVHWSNAAKKWQVSIKKDGKSHYFGQFFDLSDAVKVARDNLAALFAEVSIA